MYLVLTRLTDCDLAAFVISAPLSWMLIPRYRFCRDRNKYFLKETFYIKELPGNERHFQIYALPPDLFLDLTDLNKSSLRDGGKSNDPTLQMTPT